MGSGNNFSTILHISGEGCLYLTTGSVGGAGEGVILLLGVAGYSGVCGLFYNLQLWAMFKMTCWGSAIVCKGKVYLYRGKTGEEEK